MIDSIKARLKTFQFKAIDIRSVARGIAHGVARGNVVFSKNKPGSAMVGTSKRKRKYDLPLDQSSGGEFLKLLVILMSLLALFSIAAFTALSGLGDRWSSGLENKATIEFPVQKERRSDNQSEDSLLYSAEDIKRQMEEASVLFQNNPAVSRVTILGEKDIEALVSPWLGEGAALAGIPIPGLIALDLQDGAQLNIAALERELRAIAPEARIDTHQSWLETVLKFTRALTFGSVLLILVCASIIVVAVGGAVKAKIEINRDEIELLHLIGASDQYITKQFQKHSFFLSLKSALIGLIIGLLFLLAGNWIAGQFSSGFIPDLSLSTGFYISAFLLPLFIGGLSLFTARLTVLQDLHNMP